MTTAILTLAGSFIRANWKPIAIVIAVGGAWWAFTSWRDNLVETAEARGFGRAEQQYKAAVEAANKREQETQAKYDKLFVHFGHLSTQREQDINLRIEPQIERIEREVASDPRYRQCVVTDGVLEELNAGRAAVDQGIASSNPGAAGSRP